MKLLCRVGVFAAILTFPIFTLAAHIPSGTVVTVRLLSELTSGKNTTGQTWDGVLAKDLIVNHETIAKTGDPVQGIVSYSKSSGRLKRPGVISLRLTHVGGEEIHTSSVSRKGKSHTKSNVEKIGGGAAAGTVIGALAGGGKGAAIGAGAGAGAGTGVAAATGKQEAVFHSESTLLFTVRDVSASHHH